jgi:hypothetical protein
MEGENHLVTSSVSQSLGRLPRGFLVGQRSTGGTGTGLNDGLAVEGAADRNSDMVVGVADGGNEEEED